MGKISFIHLSDIHFVKTSGKATDIDQDLREAVLLDLKNNAKRNLENIQGVLVSGDIAFSGNKMEYDIATDFLKEVTNVLGIKESDVYCVPGNHDVDQNIPKISEPVYNAQCALDNELTLDDADKLFHKKLNDPYYNSVLFKVIEAYNEFASKYQCDLGTEKINWSHMFELDHDMKLNLYGINSCFISNADDHKDRPMYIGQAQIPKRIDDTLCIILCHHPPQYWKFQQQIEEKLNRRADIQLYGHKHTQIIEATDNNLFVYSGATHPVRGNDWNPRYNWLGLECVKESGKRIIKTKVFPRILDECRDRFIPENNSKMGEIFSEHVLHIDRKREEDLVDKRNEETEEKTEEKTIRMQEINQDETFSRDMVFKLFDLPHLKQTLILNDLELLDENEIGMPYYKIIDKIIERAIVENKISSLCVKLQWS